MRWKKGRRSDNVVDRRAARRRNVAVGGGGAVILALLAAVLLGQDPGQVLQQVGAGGGGSRDAGQQPPQYPAAEQEAMDFLRVILADTEDVWAEQFQRSGARYEFPKLVVFSGSVKSACGMSSAAAGPFYCPGDRHLYIDLSFLGELKRMGAAGDFAIAYVISHEVGHHIQTLTGTAYEVQAAKQRSSRTQGNQLQVKMELQADCYAGVWAHHGHKQRQILERGDIEEGLRAAAAVGDDHLQRQAGRRVTPEAFTHGTSEQRMTWFRRGLETGSHQACDTFGG